MIQKAVAPIRALFFFMLALIYIFDTLTELVPDTVLIVLAMATFVVSVPFMSRLPRTMTLLMFGSGQVIFFLFDGNGTVWREAMMENLPYVALFVSVPLLSIPIREGGYIEYIDEMVERFAGKQAFFYSMIAGFSAILGSFMNVASVHIMNDLFAKKMKENKRVMTESIIQGFSLSLFLSPYIGGVAVVLYLLDISLFPFVLWGFLMAVIGIGVIVIQLWLRPQHDVRSSSGATRSAFVSQKGKGVQLIAGFVCMFAAVILLENLFHINFIVIVSMIAFTFPVLWLLLLNQIRRLPKHAAHYKNNVLPNVHNQTILIVTVAFFTQMVQLTPVTAYLSGGLVLLTDLSLILTILCILLLILIPSLFGVHQLIPIMMIAASVTPEALGLAPSLFALMLTVGFSLAAQMSPVSALTLVAGQILSVHPIHFIKWNWRFVAIILVMATLFIYGCQLILQV